MICKVCKKKRPKKDFFVDKKRCYRCVYAEKVKSLGIKPKRITCRICDKPCLGSRWFYCSEKCALVAANEQKRSHWTRKVKSIHC